LRGSVSQKFRSLGSAGDSLLPGDGLAFLHGKGTGEMEKGRGKPAGAFLPTWGGKKERDFNT